MTIALGLVVIAAAVVAVVVRVDLRLGGTVAVIRQGGTVVTVGAVLVPLLRAARLSATTIGAALLLGASIGGELLNPGAPELRTVAEAVGCSSKDCVARNAPLLFAHLG